MFLSRVRLTSALAILASAVVACGGDVLNAPATPQSDALYAYYDVVVVGAGTGGTAAAIQAGRMGYRVALLEETDCIGGQMNCAGVTSMDEGNQNERNDGIYKEFVDRVRLKYGSRPIGTCYWSDSTICFEPQVGQVVLREMLGEANVQIFTGKQATAFYGGFYSWVFTQQGDYFLSRVTIDATEYGDLLPLAGVDYRVGNSQASTGINPNACVQDITYTAVIKKYPFGPPSSLQLLHPPEPLDGNPNDSYANAAAKFSLYFAPNGNPVYSSHGPPGQAPFPFSWGVHNAYRGMPDSSNSDFYNGTQQDRITKTGVNWANDFSYTTGALDRSNRFTQNCRAKLQTLQFLYWVQHELGQPNWSVADDTGYDSPWNITLNSCPNIADEFKEVEKRMPPIPYVRESRRLVGISTVTGHDIFRVSTASGVMAATNWQDGVAVGNYSTDLHNCNGAETMEAGLGDDPSLINGGGPFQIPLSALIPASVDGLIAAEKNISQSRLGNAASRLQPSTMLVGQAAGALAALSVANNTTPRNIPAGMVQSTLLNANHKTSRFEYGDIARGDTYWKAAQMVSTHDVMLGYGGSPPLFGPNDILTRRQAASTITRLGGFNPPPPAYATFADVPVGDPTFAAVEAMWRQGMTTGCGYSMGVRTYCPNDPTTRGQMAVFLVRAFSIPLATGGQTFGDVPPGYVFYPYIQALAQLGLAEPCPGQPWAFCPDAPLARGDAASMMSRLIVANTQPPPPGPIQVVAGTYGIGQGAPTGNVTWSLAGTCNNLFSCDYGVYYWVIGDPFPGTPKDYEADWTCNPGGPTHHTWLRAEAGTGSVAHLSCP
jgi:hypothetical protein